MSRSLKKGPHIDEKLMAKVLASKGDKTIIKTWARSCTIVPEFVGRTFGVHNGKEFIAVAVSEEMVGHKLGEFSHTTRFSRHGGKKQKELEQKAVQAAVPTAAPAAGAKK